jgi:hypothetical protein
VKPVTIKGADRAAARLRGIGWRALDQSSTMRKAGANAQHSISGVPIATGRLDRSVHSPAALRTTADGFTISTDVPYAYYVFAGTRHMAARPLRLSSMVGPDTARMVAHDLLSPL